MGNMSVNPLGSSIMAIDELTKIVNNGDLSIYPKCNSNELLETISQKNNISTQNIIMGNGSVEILKLILSAFGDFQQEIIFANPGFPKIIEISISEGLKPVCRTVL